MTGSRIELQNVRIEYKAGLEIPKLAHVRQTFPVDPEIDAAAAAVRETGRILSGKNLEGKQIAVAVGSRGIPGLDQIVTAVVAALRDAGAAPFIIPAMGSHGGATVEGQLKVLAAYGITVDKAGAPIRSSLEAVNYGDLDGIPLYCDANAWNADGVFLINKIKPHTDFHGEIESGLVKMGIIGLGKHAGAAAFHSRGFAGFSRRLQGAFPVFLRHVKLLGGLAVIQNAYDKLSLIEGIPAENLPAREMELLPLARDRMPSVPAAKADLLILDEIGKNISGSGFDPNVFAWEGDPESAAGAKTLYDRLYIKSLTPESEGHGTGAYFSDILSLQTVNSIDWGKTWTNCMTLNLTKSHGIPIFLKNDLEAIRTLVNCFRQDQWPGLRVLRVKNTLEMETFAVSEPLWNEIRNLPGVEILTDFTPLRFDEEGRLI